MKFAHIWVVVMKLSVIPAFPVALSMCDIQGANPSMLVNEKYSVNGDKIYQLIKHIYTVIFTKTTEIL